MILYYFTFCVFFSLSYISTTTKHKYYCHLFRAIISVKVSMICIRPAQSRLKNTLQTGSAPEKAKRNRSTTDPAASQRIKSSRAQNQNRKKYEKKVKNKKKTHNHRSSSTHHTFCSRTAQQHTLHSRPRGKKRIAPPMQKKPLKSRFIVPLPARWTT